MANPPSSRATDWLIPHTLASSTSSDRPSLRNGNKAWRRIALGRCSLHRRCTRLAAYGNSTPPSCCSGRTSRASVSSTHCHRSLCRRGSSTGRTCCNRIESRLRIRRRCPPPCSRIHRRTDTRRRCSTNRRDRCRCSARSCPRCIPRCGSRRRSRSESPAPRPGSPPVRCSGERHRTPWRPRDAASGRAPKSWSRSWSGSSCSCRSERSSRSFRSSRRSTTRTSRRSTMFRRSSRRRRRTRPR